MEPARAGAEVHMTTEQMDHTKFIIVDRVYCCGGAKARLFSFRPICI